MHTMLSLTASVLISSTAYSASNSPTFQSLSEGFTQFVSESSGKDLDGQIQSRVKNVESKLPDLYLNIVTDGEVTKLDSERKRLAKDVFPFMLSNASEIGQQFKSYESSGRQIIDTLVAAYPEADLSKVHVLGIPSLNKFNGQVKTINGQIYAMFGMDMIARINKTPELKPGLHVLNDIPVLMAHEFTHALNFALSDFGGHDPSTASFWGPLWTEGLAQVNSQMLNPGATLDEVFMERHLANTCTKKNLLDWSKAYIEDSKGNEVQLEKAYKKWFQSSEMPKDLGVYRAGYCLGYNVILYALRNNSMKQILKMKRVEAYQLAKDALASFAAVSLR